jgi:phosphate/sulfate permease
MTSPQPQASDGGPKGPAAGEPLWAFLALSGAVILSALAWHFKLPLPQCAWRQLTGIPCPFCGGTRSLVAWSQLDLARAFILNPLVSLLCCAAIVWFVLWLVDRRRKGALRAALRRRLERLRFWWVVLALMALNWIYLIVVRPF